MSKFVAFIFLAAAVTLFLIAHARAEAEAGQQQQRHRAKRHGSNMAAEMGDYPAEDVDMLQRIFRTPMKRQWCRNGMVYNPALGTCTMSLAAMRGRGRSYRGV